MSKRNVHEKRICLYILSTLFFDETFKKSFQDQKGENLETQKSVLLIVAVLVAGLLLGNFFTGFATKAPRPGAGVASTSVVLAQVDNDGDGYNSAVDCNDNNRYVNPGQVEVCGNNIDDDCKDGDAGLCKASVSILTNKSQYTGGVVTLK